ncbi:hypothetical protein PhCBS80983_g05011 [Powellomyces hirtus]|uniref:Uncharacterized protein n=1 Tax=Powellomyces hirtus TaxID=109895 RepID=A0A507DY96_9FUNG|nr:hypothetical protein PhCBS80983_g05011 [Powellomyces hirtus]
MSALLKLRPRVVHAQGFTGVAFSQDGDQILTAGDDATLRIVKTESVRDEEDDGLDQAITSDRHKAAITCMSVLGSNVVTGSEDHTVCLHDVTSGEFKRLVVRCTLTVRAVALRPGRHGTRKATWVAVASDELDIRMIDIEDITNIITIKGHKRGLKSLAFDPTGEYLVSADSDGQLNVWDLRAGTPKLARAFGNTITKSEPEENEYCQIAWHPGKKVFAVPGKLGEIAVIEAHTWKHLYNIKEENRSDCVALLSWSPTGSHLVSVSVKGRICFWKPEESKSAPLASEQAKARITGIAWHPKHYDLCITDDMGRLMYWRDAVTASEQERGQLFKLFDDVAMESDSAGEVRPGQQDHDLAAFTADLLGDLEDDDDEGGDTGAAEDFVVDDDGAGYAAPLEKPGDLRRYHEKGRKQAVKDLDKENGHRRRLEMGTLDAQEAFQPGATPMRKSRRYLAFNMVGVIYTVDASTHNNVNVEFHDRSIRPFHFTDYHNYSIAALSSSGACFASEETVTDRSRIYFRALDTWATNADWTIVLDKTESVKCLAITSRGPVAATDSRFLRFFSYSGLQTFILSMPGPVVTMAASGDWLIVIYHAGGVYHGDQNLAYMLYNTATKTTIRKDGVPLSPGSTLIWAGISELGIPATYDSTGVLRSLLPHSDFAWIPVLDSRAVRGTKQEWYWPVEVLEDKLMCVTCKAGDKIPGHPRPLLSDIPLQAPFLELRSSTTSEESSAAPAGESSTAQPGAPSTTPPTTSSAALPAAQEERLFRAGLLAAHYRAQAIAAGKFAEKEKEMLKRDVEIDKIVVQLILVACRAEKVQRALDLCNTLQTLRAIDGAIKIAVMNHLPALAERMSLVKEERMRSIADAADRMVGREQESETQRSAVLFGEPVARDETRWRDEPLPHRRTHGGSRIPALRSPVVTPRKSASAVATRMSSPAPLPRQKQQQVDRVEPVDQNDSMGDVNVIEADDVDSNEYDDNNGQGRAESPPPLPPPLPATPAAKKGNPFAVGAGGAAATPGRSTITRPAATSSGNTNAHAFEGLRGATSRKAVEEPKPVVPKRKHNQTTLLGAIQGIKSSAPSLSKAQRNTTNDVADENGDSPAKRRRASKDVADGEASKEKPGSRIGRFFAREDEMDVDSNESATIGLTDTVLEDTPHSNLVDDDETQLLEDKENDDTAAVEDASAEPANGKRFAGAEKIPAAGASGLGRFRFSGTSGA